MWNNAEHLPAYLAVPSMGAVLHTLNIRLSPEQIAYIANEAEDQMIALLHCGRGIAVGADEWTVTNELDDHDGHGGSI
jgi:acyl-CoA synthetase (AMP-forming)/AMP-acid ligase II